jgi:hypothetical protein
LGVRALPWHSENPRGLGMIWKNKYNFEKWVNF